MSRATACSSSQLRIDRAARDSHDRIVALADELRADSPRDRRARRPTPGSARRRRRGRSSGSTDVHEAAAAALARAEETTEALHVEMGSLAGRLDELFGLRHADAQVARVANERLAARLEDRSESGRRGTLDRLADGCRGAHPSSRAARLVRRGATRAIERAVLEGLADLGKQLTAKATKHGKPGKALRRSLDSLAAAIAAADARLAEHGLPPARQPVNACGPPVAGRRSFDQRTCVT